MSTVKDVSEFYGKLQGSNAFIGLPEEQEFVQMFDNTQARRGLYEQLRNSGRINGLPDTFEEFSLAFGYNASGDSRPEQKRHNREVAEDNLRAMREDGLIEEAEEIKKDAAKSKRQARRRSIAEYIASPKMTGTATGVAQPIGQQIAEQNVENALQNEEYRESAELYGEERLLHRTMRDALRDAKNVERGVIGQGAAPLAQQLLNVSTWDMGVSEGLDNLTLSALLEKADNGTITESEEMLLDTLALANVIQQNADAAKSGVTKVAEALPQSFAFMAQMAANPATGFTRSIAKRAVKKYGVDAMEMGAKELMRNYGGKALARKVGAGLAASVPEAAAFATTVGAARSIADAERKAQGGIQTYVDDNGYIQYAGHTEGEDLPTALLKSFGSTFIEGWSEMLGTAAFDPMLSLLKGVKSGKMMSSLADLKKGLNAIKGSEWSVAIKNFKQKAHWDGIINEMLEEEVGMVMSGLFNIENTLNRYNEDGTINENWILDGGNQLRTLLTIAITEGAFKAVEYVGNIGELRKMENNLKIAESDGAKTVGAKWGEIQKEIDELDPDGVADYIMSLASDPAITNEMLSAATNYATTLVRWQQYNLATDTQEYDDMSAVMRNAMAAYKAGRQMHIANFRSVQQRADKAYDALAQRDADLLKRADEWLEQQKQTGKLPVAEIETIRNGLSADISTLLDEYIGAMTARQGIYDKIDDTAYSQMDVFERDLAPVIRDGAVTTATLDGKPVYVLSQENGSAVILSEDAETEHEGKGMMVDASRLKDISTIDAKQLVDAYRYRYATDEQTKADMALNHHRNTQMPTVGMQIDTPSAVEGGTTTFIVTNVQPQMGYVELVPGEYDAEQGKVVPKNGAEPIYQTVYSTLQMQDEMYDALDAMNGVQSVQVESGIIEDNEQTEEDAPVVIPTEEEVTPTEEEVATQEEEVATEETAPAERSQAEIDADDAAELAELGDNDYISSNLDKAKKVLDKAKEKKPKATEKEARLAEARTIKAEVDAAQAEVERWTAAQREVARRALQATQEVATPSAQSEGVESLSPDAEKEGNQDKQGNPLNDNNKLLVEKVSSIDEITDEDFENPTRNIQLPQLPENVSSAIGAEGKPVVIKKNIFERNLIRHSDLTPEDGRIILKAALYSPNLFGQNQKRKKPYNWVVVSVNDNNGNNKLVLLEVNENNENVEIVHWHYTNEKGIEKLKRQAEREDGQLLILPSVYSEEAGALSSPTLKQPTEGKDTNTSETSNTVEEKNKEKNTTLAKPKGKKETQKKTSTPTHRRDRYADELNAMGEYLNFRDFVLRYFAGGGRLAWTDNGPIKGLASHLALKRSRKEYNKRIWLIASNAMHPERAAEELRLLYAQEVAPWIEDLEEVIPIDEAFNEMMDVLQSHDKPSSMLAELREMHSRGSEYDQAQEEYYRQEAFYDAYHMSEEEYALREEVLQEQYEADASIYTERERFFDDLRAEETEQINNIDNGRSEKTGDNSVDERVPERQGQRTNPQGSNEVLHETQPNSENGDRQRADARTEVGVNEESSDNLSTQSADRRSRADGQSGKTESAAERRAKYGITAKEDARREPLRERAREVAEKLGTNINVIEDKSEVTNEDAKKQMRQHKNSIVKGWFENSTGELFIVLPSMDDMADLEATILHELVAHKGLRNLLGARKFNQLCDAVWEMMTPEQQQEWLAYPGVNGNKRAAADEYIASLAEKMDLSEVEQTTWSKIKQFVLDVLQKLGFRDITENDIQDLIRASYAYMRAGNTNEQTTNEGNRYKVYRSRDGEEVGYTQLSQLSLQFDWGERERDTVSGRNTDVLQREDDATLTTLNTNRQLEEGEVCNVERIFTESKGFDFTSGEKIESAADVAYIFKNLEDEAIENVFVALVKDGKPTVIHVGMGGQAYSLADNSAVVAAANRINPDKVYLVHNHPSGSLRCSPQDRSMLKSVKDALGDVVQDGIIINTRSGKFGVFSESMFGTDGTSDMPENKEDSPLKVYKFNKQAFKSNVIAVETNPYGIAEFISTQRLGSRNKINALLLNNQFGCVGNVFLTETEVNDANRDSIAQRLVDDAVAMNAKNIVIYGNYPLVSVAVESNIQLREAIEKASGKTVELKDVIEINGSTFPPSALNYGVRFRTTIAPDVREEMESVKADAIANGTFLKAPNGKDTNLNEEQWLMVRTNNFKKWFGDWELANLYNRATEAWNNKNSKGKVIVGLSERAKKRFNELLGTNTQQLIITDDAIRHIKRQHSEREELRGQKNMTPEDIVAIPYLINNFDTMELDTAFDDNKGNRAITIRKRINGVSVIATIEKGKNKEFLVTSYQYIKSDALDASTETPGLNVRNDSDIANVKQDIENIKSAAKNSSKIVDENGEPMVVYHYTPNEFTEFDRDKIGSSTDTGAFGRGFYLSPSDKFSLYGRNQMRLFVNARNPLMLNSENAFEAKEPYYKSDYRWDTESSQQFTDAVQTQGYDAVYYENRGMDEFVVFNPNQIKSATDNNGEFGESNDISFRIVNDLIAVHNLTEDKLRKVFDMGGLIMPSIAITKVDMGHEGYGEISLLFDKDTIDPSDRRNKVFGGDAWTPRIPQLMPKLNEKVSARVKSKIRELIDDRALAEIYSLSAELHQDNIERTISERGVKGYYSKEWMKYAYLLDNGKKVKIPMIEKDYGTHSEMIFELLKEKGLKASEINKDTYDFYKNNPDIVEDIKNRINEKKASSVSEDQREAVLKILNERGMSFNFFSSLIRSAAGLEYDLENGGKKQIVDRGALRETINKKVKTDNADYNKWVDNLFEGIVEKYGIRNKTDWYTPSGNLRSWEKLYDAATPENILRYMLDQNEQGGSGGFWDSNIMGASADTYESIEEIREKGQKRLRRVDSNEYDEWATSVANRFSEISDEFLTPAQRNDFGGIIDAKIAITNAVAKDKTAKGIYKEMKADYPNFTMDHANRVVEIVKEIQDYAIGYFEAKPQRIVPLREVRKAIVPSNTSEDIVKELKDNGIEVATYRKGNEASRQRLIKKESNGIRFRTTYHGSGAKFDKFDHSHMGEGEGAQAFGWGTYVTEVEGIGQKYGNVALNGRNKFKYVGDKDVNKWTLMDAEQIVDRVGGYEEAVKIYGNKPLAPATALDNAVRFLKSTNKEDWEGQRHLYSVEIPDDNGSNYLHYTLTVGADKAERVGQGLEADGWTLEYSEGNLAKYTKDDKSIFVNRQAKGADLYQELADVFGSEKDASLFLNEIGFVGIAYPAEYYSGGRSDGALNYVIFNEDDLEITNHTMFRIKEVNDKFNEELQQQIDGTLPKGHIYQLGMPSGILQACGFPDMPIELSSTNLAEHSRKTHHPFELNDVKGLVYALQDPVAVFSYGDKMKSQNVIVEIQRDDRNFLIGVHFNQNRRGLEVSDIRGVFPKDSAEWLNWINQDKALYLDKEKIQDLIRKQRKTLAEVEYLDLDSVAKVIEDFENPTIESENSEVSEDRTMFSVKQRTEADYQDIENRLGIAAAEYERRMDMASVHHMEAWQDSMRSLLEMQRAIEKETGKPILDYENAYMAENRMSSENLAQMEEWKRKFFKPLLDIYKGFIDRGENEFSIRDYLFAKHGMERNAVMARREAQRLYPNDPLQQIAKESDLKRTKDYSGLKKLMGKDNIPDAIAEAQKYVHDFEKKHKAEIAKLWDAIRNATHSQLEVQRASGLLTQEKYEEIKNMYNYYVPLRGFSETTTDEVYDYLDNAPTPYNVPIKAAKGRESVGDDPIANIANMAESGIMQANRNKMKLHFLNMAERHKTNLVTVSEVIYKYNPVTKMWEPTLPALSPNDTIEETLAKIRQHRANVAKEMVLNPQDYKTEANLKKMGTDIPYKVINKSMLSEHQVLVMREGKQMVMTINGNPRAAQALNGLTNPEVKAEEQRWIQKANRFMAANFTSRNPAFVISNLSRDSIYAVSMVWAKEAPKYARAFMNNMGKVFANMASLMRKYNNGTLDTNVPMEKMFLEFVMNGGQTGYTHLNSVEDYKRQMAKEMKRAAQHKGVRAVTETGRAILNGLESMNKWAENISRFTAYVTSREDGRSISRSISDAKEISVNFNKKGAGNSVAGKFEKGNRLNYLSSQASQLARGLYVFMNAGIQGMANFAKQAKRHPYKITAMIASSMALGLAAALLSGGGDDEEEYLSLPKYTRRNNLCIKVGDKFVTIPLPIELRAFYGIGELIASRTALGEYYSDAEFAKELAEQLSQLLPIDVLEGGEGFNIKSFIPSAAKPIVDVILNESWTGIPIYNDSEFVKTYPGWKKAYKGTNDMLVDVSRWLNEHSGGSDYKQGWMDINPAAIEYIAEQYFGGVGTTINQFFKMGQTATGAMEFEWRNVPVASRFVNSGNETTQIRAIRNSYYDYREEMDAVGKEFNAYMRDLKKPDLKEEEYQRIEQEIDRIVNSPEYDFYLWWKDINKVINRAKDAGDTEGADELMREAVETYRSWKKGLKE